MEESRAYLNPELKGKSMEEWIHFKKKKKTKIQIKNRIPAEKIQAYENCFEKELETDSHYNKEQQLSLVL